MKLVVVSHTAHRRTGDGVVMGWGPTAREIDVIAPSFEHVWHLAFLHPGEPPVSYVKYDSPNVTFVPLRPAGGETLWQKLLVVLRAYSNLKVIRKHISKADAVQLRLPTGMGVYLLPWIAWTVKRTFKLWVKYAGNWAHPSPPLSYRFQRWFLTKNLQKSKVTINGSWPGQPGHCLTFENPCLTDEELTTGREVAEKKDFSAPLKVLFVGRIENAKGVDKLLLMIKGLSIPGRIDSVVFAGDGDIQAFNQKEWQGSVPVTFLGAVSRPRLNELYSESHILILPSASEGFPKVVAEASAFGCVPMVSNVSSLGQYINSSNGHLFTSLDPEKMVNEFEMIVSEPASLKERSQNAVVLAERFTYTYYSRRIFEDILK